MRITWATFTLLAAASIALSGCGGGGGEGGTGDFNSPNNLPPVITGTPPTTLAAGTQYSFQPQSSDPEGDKLTFSATNLPAWASINATTGLVTGTPAEANVGMSGMITIGVSDGKATSELPDFRIQVTSAQPPPANVNSPPTITGTPGTQATVGMSYSFTPVGDDVDDDTLTYSITNKPTWATFTAATGALVGTPASNNVGTTSGIVISVSDGTNAAVALPAFNLTVATTAPANRAPTISGTPNTSVTVGQAYNFRPTASDPDGNTLQWSISGKPSWLNFSATTGRLNGTPTAAAVGSSRMTITVSDGTLSASLAAFTLTVNAAANLPPVISGSPSLTATVGQAYSFTPTASDPEGATLTFSIANKPTWLNFSTTNGALTGTPSAGDVGTTAAITISANDGTALGSLSPFAIVVAQVANGSATITWVAPTENTDNSPLTLGGYRLTYGRSETQLDQSIDISNPGLTSYTVNNLATGTWYFAMYARSSTGAESDMSNIANKTIN